MKTYFKSLFKGATVFGTGLHTLEDVGLISFGALVILPLWVKWIVGAFVSWFVLGFIVDWATRSEGWSVSGAKAKLKTLWLKH